MRVALKYRIYPSKAQETTLNHVLGVCCDVYNSLVNERTALYEITGESPNYHAQAVALTRWKKGHAELCDVHSQVLQNVAVRVDLAFQSFFRRVKAGEKPGYPRMKGYGYYDSITYPQSGFKAGESSVWVSLMGRPVQIKAKIHRPIVGAIKTCTVRRLRNKWYVCFACEYEPEPLPKSDEAIGIDMGLKSFMALSDGTFVENPRFFRRDEKALAIAGRRQSKTAKGSRERRKRNKVLSRIHERIWNRRHNFCHQLSRKLVNAYGLIAVEKLNVKGMVLNHHLAKSISDAAWSQFRSRLAYKAESAGRVLIEINPAYTSQDCSVCGYRAKKKLSERWHHCPKCGVSLDRDTNAAINILTLGQQRVAGIPA